MTVDREQTRREAEGTLSGRDPASAKRLANRCLALLAELEQAERERAELISTADRAQAEARNFAAALQDAEAQLAKVPALVKAARRLQAITAEHSLDNDVTPFNTHTDYAAASFALGEALATYEQKPKP